jgi:hypothetical protein
MELLRLFVATKSGIFSMRLMYLQEVVSSYAVEGLNEEDASNTFVSAKFSRSFV